MDRKKTALDVSFIIFIGINVYSLVESAMIATNTFTVTDHTPKGNGIWQAYATCNTNFPGKSYGPNEAYMFTRFGVPVLSYLDYLGGNWFEMDPDKMWVISRIGYGSGGDSLSYGLQFEHDVWLGAGTPTGDCHQFTDLQEATDFAASASTLSDTPADTLVSSSDLEIVSTGHAGSQGVCRFSFPGIKFGTQETVVLVSFSVPVTYQSDYIGNTVLHAADDSTWYIVRNVYGQENSIDYQMNFAFISSDTDVSSAYCSLYASETDAVAASTLLGPTTTPSTAASVNPPTTVPFTVSGTTSGSNTSPNSTGTSVVHRKSAGYIYESRGMRNIYVQENNIWKETTNILRCARLCLADKNCISLFYRQASSECTAHSMVYGNGTPMQGVSYYIVK